ncbi:AzlC family ABC transporter permease [Acinetobacter rathckeae]|uniref:AzlC family ABC transporter permease n=1 Tax=Acinetobacter rathckeae TaxID=2605272 RepID=UPI002B1BCF7F|nr:AzlC family ABC transporter permease [Acinetobacter rathckeae]
MSHERTPISIEEEKQSKYLFYKGVLDMLPLSISAIPWAILAGSMAIHAGLSNSQALGMSIVMFAGAAQLVSLGLVMAGSSTISIFLTVFFITAQHFIYALTLRNDIKHLPIKHRLSLGFLLTDELFAIGSDSTKRNFYYLLGAGLCFYIFWIAFSAVGVFLASTIPNLQSYHLDFSIIAIFIPLILTLIKDKLTFCSVLLTAISMFLLTFFHIQGALIIAGLFGMVISTLLENLNTQRSFK